MNLTQPLVYPPTALLSEAQDTFVVLQFTDLHIKLRDLDNAESASLVLFKTIVQQALRKKPTCDLIVVSGDLVDNVDVRIYDAIFNILETTSIPFVCISGNHDVTDEVGEHLEFHQRELVPYDPDSRLVDNHVIDTNHWQILLLDSSVLGKVSGYIKDATIGWLHKQLSSNTKPALIFMHHHALPMGSAWLDEHITLNSDALWECLEHYPHVKLLICGHVHQDSCKQKHSVTAYSTPSTSYQFVPEQDDFQLDLDELPGYRWIELKKNGQFISAVQRLD